jgi:hypothetical protein
VCLYLEKNFGAENFVNLNEIINSSVRCFSNSPFGRFYFRRKYFDFFFVEEFRVKKLKLSIEALTSISRAFMSNCCRLNNFCCHSLFIENVNMKATEISQLRREGEKKSENISLGRNVILKHTNHQARP